MVDTYIVHTHAEKERESDRYRGIPVITHFQPWIRVSKPNSLEKNSLTMTYDCEPSTDEKKNETHSHRRLHSLHIHYHLLYNLNFFLGKNPHIVDSQFAALYFLSTTHSNTHTHTEKKSTCIHHIQSAIHSFRPNVQCACAFLFMLFPTLYISQLFQRSKQELLTFNVFFICPKEKKRKDNIRGFYLNVWLLVQTQKTYYYIEFHE